MIRSILQSLVAQTSGSTEGMCNGSFHLPISHLDMADAGWVPGSTIHVQWIYQDPGQTDGTPWGHTPGALFNICP